ncbi:MAG: type II toxin-antitoxin system RelE/ParE family toxin [Chthoniobacter sp.]|uniref:type II toxin-antitoxin system RelE/ParE family toxin n=1 Tax=Chthoniobacter sp. TaxID=2510640 RepID=UPI0032A73A69
MPGRAFRVIFAREAERDLYEIRDYWISRGETGRGTKYFLDLLNKAETLRSPKIARTGRKPRDVDVPDVREIVAFKHSYRILYRLDETNGVAEVLRFWHTHRDTPPIP